MNEHTQSGIYDLAQTPSGEIINMVGFLTHAIYRLRFFSNLLIHILSLSNLHNNVASIQKNRDDKSHRVIVALIK